MNQQVGKIKQKRNLFQSINNCCMNILERIWQNYEHQDLWHSMAFHSSHLKCHLCNFNKFIFLLCWHAPCNVLVSCHGDREGNDTQKFKDCDGYMHALTTELPGHPCSFLFYVFLVNMVKLYVQQKRVPQHYSLFEISLDYISLLTSSKNVCSVLAFFLALMLRFIHAQIQNVH